MQTFVNHLTDRSPVSSHRILLQILIIFLIAFAARAAAWYYWRTEAFAVQTSVATNYKVFARLLTHEGLTGFLQPTSEMSNPDLLGHPPGYPILLAVVYRFIGESDSTVQLLQIFADSLAAVLVLLIANQLLNATIAFIAGLLAAMSPQFAWNSILLLPDTLAVLPLLLAIYLFIRAFKDLRPRILFVVGALVGVSCLLRPNALLLAPMLAVGLLFLDRKSRVKRRWIAAAFLVLGTVAMIAPITIRNAIVFGKFVPLSLGAGQTLLEGIADYDPARRFGFPETDVEIARMEAETFHRPDYANTLFGPDGIERERLRLRQGMRVVVSNPLWFGAVMIQRAGSMLRLERVPLISAKASQQVGYPTALRVLQKVFVTAVILPLAFFGVGILIVARRWLILVMLLVVPFYYFTVQSALHTEYRYILALNDFQFILAAIPMSFVVNTISRLRRGVAVSSHPAAGKVFKLWTLEAKPPDN